MIFFSKNKKKNDLPLVTVETSIIAFMKDQYLNEVFTISVPQGTSIKELLKTAKERNIIKKDVYKFVRKLNPPISLIVNGNNLANNKKDKHPLEDGDQITIFTPLSGG